MTRALSLAARSASTMRSSSSPGSRWVRRFPQFDAPWTNYPANNFDGLGRRQRHGHWCEPVHLHRSVRQRRVGHHCRLQDPIAYYAGWHHEPDRALRRAGMPGWCIRRQQHRRHARSRHRSACCRSTRLGVCSSCRLLLITTTLAIMALPRPDRSSRRQVGLGCSGCLVDQEHPDRCGRRDQLAGASTPDGATRYNLQRPGRRQLLDVRRNQPAGRLPEHRLFANAPDADLHGHFGARTAPGLRTSGPGASAAATPITGIPTGTLASTVLTLRSGTATSAALRSAPTRGLLAAGRWYGAGCNPDFNIAQAWYHHPLDPGQEPDLLGVT